MDTDTPAHGSPRGGYGYPVVHPHLADWDDVAAAAPGGGLPPSGKVFMIAPGTSLPGSLLWHAARALAGVVLRPLPTLALFAVYRAADWATVKALPEGSSLAWVAHAVYAFGALGSVAFAAREMDRAIDEALDAHAERSPATHHALGWAVTAASILAAALMAGIAFDWLSALVGGGDRFHLRTVVQAAACCATLAWRASRPHAPRHVPAGTH